MEDVNFIGNQELESAGLESCGSLLDHKIMHFEVKAHLQTSISPKKTSLQIIMKMYRKKGQHLMRAVRSICIKLTSHYTMNRLCQ